MSFGSSDTQAGLPGNYQFTTADNGVKSFSASLKTAGLQSLTASDTVNGSLSGTQSDITVTAAAASEFRITGYPSPTQAGIQKSFTVTVTDPYGNFATGYTGTVKFSSSDPQAGLPSNYTFTSADNGVRSFSATLRTVGTQSLTVTDSVNKSGTGTQNGINVTPSNAVAFTLSGFPSTSTAGTPGTFTLTARDAFGNLATSYSGTVAFSSSDPQATLPGNYTFLAIDAGVGTFPATLRSAGPQSITAQDLANPSISGTIANRVVTSSTAQVLTISQFPTSATAGVATQITVTFRDAFGNPASTYNGTVVFASSDPDATLPTAGAIVNGVGVFPIIFRTGGIQSITATDAANPAATASQGGIQVLASAATLPAAFAVGTDAGILNQARVYNTDLSVRNMFQVYEQEFTGGVRVAMNASPTTLRLVTSPGPGRQGDVRLYDLTTGSVTSFLPFESSFVGGVFVSSGDFNADGFDDIVASADQGGGPRVKILNGRTGEVMADFYGIEDPNFRGGARTGVGDINGDGVPDLVVSAGYGGGPRIAIYDGTTVLSGSPARLVNDFFAYEPSLRNGAFVTVGDIDGDGFAEVITGAGPGGGPRVTVFSGASLIAGQINPINNFILGDPESRGGIRVATTNMDGDSLADLVVGSGENAGSQVTGYLGQTLKFGQAVPLFEFDEVPGFTGGVFVG